MKKQRKYSQLKEQDKSPERTNNETDHTSLLNPELKKEIIKILKELRKSINRNSDHYYKELERIKVNSSKLDNSIAEIKTCRGPAPADPGYSKRGRRRRPIYLNILSKI